MNFFGQQKPGTKKRNPLEGLMQPQLMEMLAGHEPSGPVGLGHQPPPQLPQQQFDPNVFFQVPPQDQPPPHQSANPFGQAQMQQPPPQQQAPQQQKPPSVSNEPNVGALYGQSLSPDMGPIMKSGAAKTPSLEDAGGLLWRGALMGVNPPLSLGLLGKKVYDMASGPENSLKITSHEPDPVEEPPAPPKEHWNLGPDNKGGGLYGMAVNAAEEMKKYGEELSTLDGAKRALKAEFQDTPELDAIIAKTESELATTRANRKQPGIGEFLVMALMNLGGMNPSQSADLVLGLGEQRQREGKLEDQLAQLEGNRAGAKMQGRRGLRQFEADSRYRNLEAMMKQQETARKQGNEDREFGFKNQKFGGDKLMQAIGQMRNQLGTETDPAKKKALQDAIDRMDPYNPKNQKAPVDNRQSRMFGDLLGGGGYA